MLAQQCPGVDDIVPCNDQDVEPWQKLYDDYVSALFRPNIIEDYRSLLIVLFCQLYDRKGLLYGIFVQRFGPRIVERTPSSE